MKIIVRLVLAAALAAAGVWLWTVLFPSPEKIVLKKINDLAATVSVGANDGTITRATKVSNVISYFSTDAEISYDIAGLGARTMSGRDEIRETAAAGLATLKVINVRFFDAAAHIGADKQTAEVTCTAQVNLGDARDFGLQELRFQLKKIEGDWRITRGETVKTLR